MWRAGVCRSPRGACQVLPVQAWWPDPEVECDGGRTRASVQLGRGLPSPSHGAEEEPGPRQALRLQPSPFLPPQPQEPTLDEPVQHLLTASSRKTGRAEGDRHPRDLRQARPGLPPQGSGRQGRPGPAGRRRTGWAAEARPAAAAGPVAASAAAAGSGSAAPSWLSSSMPCSSQGPSGGTLPASPPQHRLGEEAVEHEEVRHALTPTCSTHRKPWGLTTHSLAQESGQQLSAQACQDVRPGPGRGTTNKSPCWMRSRATCGRSRPSVCTRHRSCLRSHVKHASVSSVSQENSPRSCDRNTPWVEQRGPLSQGPWLLPGP